MKNYTPDIEQTYHCHFMLLLYSVETLILNAHSPSWPIRTASNSIPHTLGAVLSELLTFEHGALRI